MIPRSQTIDVFYFILCSLLHSFPRFSFWSITEIFLPSWCIPWGLPYILLRRQKQSENLLAVMFRSLRTLLALGLHTGTKFATKRIHNIGNCIYSSWNIPFFQHNTSIILCKMWQQTSDFYNPVIDHVLALRLNHSVLGHPTCFFPVG